VTRRDLITLLGGAVAWPLAARAQQPVTPVVGLLSVINQGLCVALRPAFADMGKS